MSMGPENIERLEMGQSTLWVVPESRLPMVEFTVALRYGAACDPVGRSGTLQIMMDLLLRGTRTQSRGVFQTALERLGSSLDTVVGQDIAYIHGTALARHLPETLGLLTQALLSPAFDPHEMARLIEETEQGLLAERDDDDALADLFLQRQLFGAHPLGQSPSGSRKSLRTLQQEDIHKAHQTMLASNFLIGVVGDISAQQAERLFHDLVYNRPLQTDATPALLAPVIPSSGMHIVVIDKPERTQVQLRLAQLVMDGRHADVDAFFLGIMAFGGTFTSPLTREVRDVRGWSYFAHADFRRRSCFLAPLVLRSAPGIDDAMDCLALELELYTDLAHQKLAQRDLQLARDYLLNRFPFDIATAYDILNPVMQLDLLGLPPSHLWDFPKRLEALTLARIPELVAKHLDANHIVISLVAPAQSIVPKIQNKWPHAHIHVKDYREGLDT